MEKDKIMIPCKLLIIAGSAGSIEVILELLPNLKQPVSFAVVIVLHRKSAADSSLSDLFSTRTAIPVMEVEDKQLLKSGNIYIAPPDYHLLFEKNNLLSLDLSEKVNYSRPSIDVSFESAADVYEAALTCLLLSGANADGALGLKTVKRKGGQLAVQNPDTAQSSYMPEQALSNNDIDFILTPDKMAAFINGLQG